MNEILKYKEVKYIIPYNTYNSWSESEQIFDTNSFRVGVDNIYSGCISHKVEYLWGH